MKLSNHSISQLVPFVVGDNHEPYRSASQLLMLFNEYGGFDYLPSKGFPIMPNSHLKYSRKTFAEQKMAEINDTDKLRRLLEYVINSSKNPSAINTIKQIISHDGYSIEENDNTCVIVGDLVDNCQPVATEAYFLNLEKQVLDTLDKARVSIWVAMAWFTNENIKNKLISKKREGVDVDIVIYDDVVNHNHGVDLSDLPYMCVKSKRGGYMHNKFCIIDNQIVMTGSYNWTKNAETHNDENISILKDPETASDYSVEFKRIKGTKE